MKKFNLIESDIPLKDSKKDNPKKMYILKKKATKHSNKRISSFMTSNSENPKKKILKRIVKGKYIMLSIKKTYFYDFLNLEGLN